MVELLVTTVCLAVTAVGLLTAIAFADTQNKLSRQRKVALAYASSEMEKYRSKAYYASITPGTFTTPLNGGDLPMPASLVVTVTATADPRVFNVLTQVSWTVMLATGNTTRAIKLETVMRNSDGI